MSDDALEFLIKNEQPIRPDSLQIRIDPRDFSADFSPKDAEAVEHRWAEIMERHKDKGLFSRPRSLGTLYDLTPGTCAFRTTEFKHWVAVHEDKDRAELSPHQYDMRVSSVGGVLKLSDGYVVVQRRAPNLLCEPGKLDSSAAGFAAINGGTIHFEKAVRDKLQQELNIGPDEIVRLTNTGVHSGRAYCYSGMWDFLIETRLDRRALDQRLNRERVHECVYVHENDLPDFVSKRYGHGTDLLVDGAGALLASLDQKTFYETVERLRRDGRRIASGTLMNGALRERAPAPEQTA